MIAAGETGGRMAEVLDRVVALLEEEAFSRASQQFIVIVVCLYILMLVGLALIGALGGL
jgi:type II secretory pathway component PulF